jgi:hypothetical protein
MATGNSTRKPTEVTPEHVAHWLAARLRRHRCMDHERVVGDVRHWFGIEFSHEDGDGRLTFTEPVLAAFHKLTRNRVKYHEIDGLWR